LEVITLKKFLFIFISIFLIFLTFFYFNKKSLFHKEVNQPEKTKETLVYESINSFYVKEQPKNIGELKIYNIKNFDEDLLVLCEKYSDEGQRYSDLFILSKNYEIIASTTGEIPISMCFSANKITYKNHTILFGNFNNTKWDVVKDIRVPVTIDTIKIKLDNGTLLTEQVSIENGYIMSLNSNSVISDISLYSKNDELQSNLKDIGSINESTLNLIDSINN
jgi:hypothetical protein